MWGFFSGIVVISGINIQRFKRNFFLALWNLSTEVSMKQLIIVKLFKIFVCIKSTDFLLGIFRQLYYIMTCLLFQGFYKVDLFCYMSDLVNGLV